MVDAIVKHVGLEPCLVFAAPIGADFPDISGGVGGVDYSPPLAAVAVCGRGRRHLADKAGAPIDVDVRLVAEHLPRDLRQQRPVGAMTDLAPRSSLSSAHQLDFDEPCLVCRAITALLTCLPSSWLSYGCRVAWPQGPALHRLFYRPSPSIVPYAVAVRTPA